MRSFIFRYLFLLSACCLVCHVADAQKTKHEKKVERYMSGWNRLVPRYGKLQFAGSMGVISAGVGWDYGKKKQWETDVFLGYLPKFDGDEGHMTFTVKENYIPWKLPIKEGRWIFEPFTVSLYVNKIFGDEFWAREPDRFPERYYGVATNLRFNLAFGQRIDFKLRPVGLAKRLAFYYEVGSNDLYIISAFTNRYLHFTDIFSLSLGLKFQFL